MSPAVVTFIDVPGEPKVRLELPLVRLGDKLELQLCIQRRNAGRTEELRVSGEFRVTALTLDARGRVRQLIQVSASGVTPRWHPVKNAPASRFPLKRLDGFKVAPQD